MTDAPAHAAHAAHAGGNLLTKRVGALPVYGWVGVTIAGIALGTAAKRRFSANSAGAVTDAAAVDPNAPGPTQGALEVQVSALTTDAPSTPQNNADWSRAAEARLIGMMRNPLTVMSAITKYLQGDPLTQGEADLVTLALQQLGPPPDGAPPITVLPAPAAAPSGTTGAGTPAPVLVAAHTPAAPKPAAASTTHAHSYTVVSGDTLWGISARFYGTGALYGRIYSANRGTIEATAKAHGRSSSGAGHWIYPGESLVIP